MLSFLIFPKYSITIYFPNMWGWRLPFLALS
jgi:hypothetical protein